MICALLVAVSRSEPGLHSSIGVELLSFQFAWLEKRFPDAAGAEGGLFQTCKSGDG